MSKQIIEKWGGYGFLEGLNDIQTVNVANSMEYITNKLIHDYKDLISYDNYFEIAIFPVLRNIIQKAPTLLPNKEIKRLSNDFLEKFKIWWGTERLELISSLSMISGINIDIEAKVLKLFIEEYLFNIHK